MSLDKAIEHKKEKRKKYAGAKAIDKTCRNHGSCEYCKSNRLHKYTRSIKASESALKEYTGGII